MLLALLATCLCAALADDGGLPHGLAADLRGFGAINLEGWPEDIHLGGLVRIEGTVTLLDWSLDGDTLRDSVADPRGVGVVRAGALLAVCEQPRAELAAHAGERVIVQGRVSCERGGQACDPEDTAQLLGWDAANLHASEDAPAVVVLPDCAWTLAPVELPPATLDALGEAGVRTRDGSPLAVGAPVRVVGQASGRAKGGPVIYAWASQGDPPLSLRCETSARPATRDYADRWVEAVGVLGCEPGLSQECSAEGTLWRYRVGLVYPQGRAGLIPTLEGCRLRLVDSPASTRATSPRPDLRAPASEARTLRAESRGWWLLPEEVGTHVAQERRACLSPPDDATAARCGVSGSGPRAIDEVQRGFAPPPIDLPIAGAPSWRIPRLEPPPRSDVATLTPQMGVWLRALPVALTVAPTEADLAVLHADLTALSAEIHGLEAGSDRDPLSLSALDASYAALLLGLDDALRRAPPGPASLDAMRRLAFDEVLRALDRAQDRLDVALSPPPAAEALRLQRWVLDLSRQSTRGSLSNMR